MQESEKENFCKSRKAAELETLVTFLSKFDSKVAAIWEGDHGVKNKGQVWEQELPAAADPQEEDLLISPKTHFKPIRDYREEIQPPLAFLPLPQVTFIQIMPTIEGLARLNFMNRVLSIHIISK